MTDWRPNKATIMLAAVFLALSLSTVTGCGSGPWTDTGGSLSRYVTECLAFDPIHSTLYAGTNGYGVWKNDGSSWTMTEGSRLLDMVYALTFDPRHSLLYAGCYNTRQKMGGAWKYDGSSWTNTGGEVSNYAGVALACGSGNSGNNVIYACFDDYEALESKGIWKYDGATWTDTGAPGGGALSFDSTHNLLYASRYSPGSGESNGVWKYNGSTWTSTNGEVSDYGVHTLAYDPVGNMLYAGAEVPYPAGGNPEVKIDGRGVYRFDGTAWKKTGGPSGRNNVATDLICDSEHNLLYAGTYQHGVWKYDGKIWTETGGSVAGYSVKALAYDPVHKVLYAIFHDYSKGQGKGVWKYSCPK